MWDALLARPRGEDDDGSGDINAAGQYNRLLAQAVQLGKRHEAKARHFVPRMYRILVEKERLSPRDAAERMYKDLAGVWQKDTIRRLLPAEAKNRLAIIMQRKAVKGGSAAGLILRKDICDSQTAAGDGGRPLAELEQENVWLRKVVVDLEKGKKSLLEKVMQMERALATAPQKPRHNPSACKEMTVVLPPHLFMKTFTLMRSSTRPLLFKVGAGGEVIEVERLQMFGR